MANIYYDPEKWGLEVFAEHEFLGGYEFDKLVVWRDPSTGDLYYADDSGCSCPTPFEDVVSTRDLTKATKFEIIEHAKSRSASRRDYGGDELEISALIERVMFS